MILVVDKCSKKVYVGPPNPYLSSSSIWGVLIYNPSYMKKYKKSLLLIVSVVIFLVGYDLCSLRKNTIFNISVPFHGAIEGIVGVAFMGIAWGIWSLRK
jgi:hypothetical protein